MHIFKINQNSINVEINQSLIHELPTDEIHTEVYIGSPLIEPVVLKDLGNEVEKLDMCEHENDESSELLKTDGESNIMESEEVNKSVNFEATENFRDVLEMADTEESEELQPEVIGASENEIRAFEVGGPGSETFEDLLNIISNINKINKN